MHHAAKSSALFFGSLWAFSLLFSPPVSAADDQVFETLLSQKIATAATLVSDSRVTDAIRSQNQKWSALPQADIEEYNRTVIHTLMTNACAQTLLEFQKVNPAFIEIFITDKKGLNVCQTNKTSDFYQADEAWWTKAYGGGAGLSYSGKIEYDERARSQSVPVFLPVRDVNDSSVIGVCKAVISLPSLADEL